MNGLSLFTGSGIGELAFKHIIPGYKTICYVEWDKYCQKLIQARINDGLLCDAPIWDDIRTFDGKPWAGKVDIVSGGFPCQPFSVAGKNKGADDERNMWPDTFRVISEVRPRYAFLENVPNLLTHEYARRIFADMAQIGYGCEWDIIPAAFVGAPHLRKRVWILAYSTEVRRRGWDNGNERRGCREIQTQGSRSADQSEILADSNASRQPQSEGSQQNKRGRIGDESKDVANTNKVGRKLRKPAARSRQGDSQGLCSQSKTLGKRSESNWSVEPDVGRVAHGVASRVDRLEMLGNGWVIHVVARILQVDSDVE